MGCLLLFGFFIVVRDYKCIGIKIFVVIMIIISLISIGIEVCFIILKGEIFVMFVIVIIMFEIGDSVWFRFEVCSIGIIR